MPRSLFETEPVQINFVKTAANAKTSVLEVATHNKNKLAEFERLLPKFKIVGKDLKIEEIQSTDPLKVAEYKAREAFTKNDNNPILVEDTSVEIKALNSLPGTYVNDFFSDLSNRKLFAEEVLKGRPRDAKAIVTLAIFDGKEIFTWQGITTGKISEKLIGNNGFGWDDIFVPDGGNKTFAQMSDKQKDKFSMRRKAIENFAKKPPKLGYPVYQINEPFEQELERVQIDKLQNKDAINFAFCLESLEGIKPNKEFKAEKYAPIDLEANTFFTRYKVNKNTKSLGLMLTDVDRKHLRLHKNGNPFLWQIGPERRHLALAQRAEYFLLNQSEKVHKILDNLEKNKDSFPKRNNSRSQTIERALGMSSIEMITEAHSLKEIGYKKLSSEHEVSRSFSKEEGLFSIIGKYPRSIYSVGSMPAISGWRDVITTAAIGHMITFVHRNSLHAVDFSNQIQLIKASQKAIKSLNLNKTATERALRNIGAAIGANPVEDMKKAERLYKEAQVRLFRIYTINSDPRVIETARNIRQKFGNEVEIFVGQVVDKKQCRALVSPDIAVDGLIFGHGGGRQCTSATNGMALSTLEELYSITTDPLFNRTSLLVEGGIGSHVGALLIMGVDGILRNAQFANCVIEQGDLYFEHKSGEYCQPYHGSASAATMIIESFNKKNIPSRLSPSGRTKNVEGKPGYIYYREKANSMAFYVDEFNHYAARALADLGVKDIPELKEFLAHDTRELLRIVSTDANYTSGAYGS